jgi:hypothetical protein
MAFAAARARARRARDVRRRRCALRDRDADGFVIDAVTDANDHFGERNDMGLADSA